MVSGIVIMVVGLPIALLMRHKPEQYGMLPDGATKKEAKEGTKETDVSNEPQISPWQSLRMATFWFLGMSLTLRSLVTTGLTIHFVAMMVDRGFSLSVASSLLGSVALLSIVGRLGMAWLGDYVDKRYLLAGCNSVMGLSLLALAMVSSWWLVGAALVVYSVAYGGSIVLPMALQAEYFGRRSFATIRGLIGSIQTPGMLVGPVFAGLVYDMTQEYFVAFLGFAAAGILAAVLLLGIRKPKAESPLPAIA